MSDPNGVMLQYFHWYTAGDGSHWRSLAERAADLRAAGFTSVWLPPAYKGAGGGFDTGYGAYDLFDLGEFDQKGSVRTKYGTKDEYLAALEAARAAGLRVYADIVLSHRLGGDRLETFNATPYDPEDRTRPIGEPQEIEAWTNFTFPGRRGAYSTLEWHWWHFNAVDKNMRDRDSSAVYLFEGKSFQEEVDREKGNYDYLLGCNVDIANPDVRHELFHWGEWYLETTGVDGFRFDAVKHVGAWFFVEWLEHLRQRTDRELFAVGEYWSGDLGALQRFIEVTGRRLKLFDATLHFNVSAASRAGASYDLRTIFDGTLVQVDPDSAVTLVSNHDTQPLQALESPVEAWFKPLAYALILLRVGGYPCVFLADYDGAEYTDVGRDGAEHHVVMPSHSWLIDRFLLARRHHAYGDQTDYFDDPNVIGWTRHGTDTSPGGMAVLLSNAGDGAKRMRMPAPGAAYRDLTDHVAEEVVTDQDGWGEFRCNAGSVSVWVPATRESPLHVDRAEGAAGHD